MKETADKSVPKAKRKKVTKWLSDEAVKIADERRDVRSKGDDKDIAGSFFQHGNNSGKHDTVAFHGACIECNMNVYAMGMSIATLKCLAFQTYMTLHV